MSRSNHNANYIYDVDGETVWEKLRVIRNFLQEKKLNLSVSQLHQSKCESLKIDSFEYKEYMIYSEQRTQLMNELCDEIKFLEEFESYLSAEAEKTRVPGKSDEEMYEINYFDELVTRLVKKAQAQFISSGSIDPDTMLRLMKNKPALNICISQGMLTDEVRKFIETPYLPSPDIHTSKFLEMKKDA